MAHPERHESEAIGMIIKRVMQKVEQTFPHTCYWDNQWHQWRPIKPSHEFKTQRAEKRL